MSTESLLREILQEIREVKAHFVPVPAVSLRPSAVASAGGSVNNVLSHFASASESAKASAKVAPIIADDLVYNELLGAFISRDGTCFYSDFDENTLEAIPDMSRIIGRLRPGVNRESAQPSNFVASNARSRKRKNRRNRTRKN